MKAVQLLIIPLEKINLEDRRFCLSPVINFEPLVSSLRQAGLLVPPVVKEKDEGFLLVSGWKRILACRTLNFNLIPVLVFPEDSSDLEIFLRSLEENLAQRPLSLAERIEAVNKLTTFGVSETEVIKKFMPRLSLPVRESYYKLFLDLARTPDLELKQFLHETEIPLEALEILASFCPADRSVLLSYLKFLSFSRRREVIFNLQAIILREKITVAELLASTEAKAILEAEKPASRHKAEALAEWLRRRRYPLITTWEEEKKRIKKEISWPEEVKLTFDPTFEDDSFMVRFTFRSAGEFLARVEQLRSVAEKPGFGLLFRRSL